MRLNLSRLSVIGSADPNLARSYKANPASVLTTVVDEDTGEEKKRLINRMRWKGFGPIAINFSEKGVPDKPSDTIEKQRPQADKKLLKRLEEVRQVHPHTRQLHSNYSQLFEERPVWTRTALFNQFTGPEVREILKSECSSFC